MTSPTAVPPEPAPNPDADPAVDRAFDPDAFGTYLEKTRWFGGKGRPLAVTGVERIGRLGRLGDRPGEPMVEVMLVEVTYGDVAGEDAEATDAVEHYQVPLSYYTEPEHRLDHAFVGWWEDPDAGWVHAYDALHDREATGLWLRAFGEAAEQPYSAGGLVFHRVPGSEIDVDSVGLLFSGEQSNSSVLFGEDSVLKLFRKVSAGANPDITVHDALTRAGSTDVASLYGWVEGPDGTHLGMLQQFLRTATDGWDLALASVRTLFAEPDVAARESGGDFVGEAERLGLTLRDVHSLMVDAFGASTAPTAAVARAMTARLTRAATIAPALTPYVPGLNAVYERLADLPDVEVQRVHGDLHLGQTLRTALGWKIVDFEGEPVKTLAERVLPDSPWRDVAGMMRSFDYAPHAVEHQLGDLGEPDQEQAANRALAAVAWSERNQRHFLSAYAGGEPTDDQRLLVDAYLADKAVYETVYETRNRPSWVGIPLAAIARIGAV